MTDVTQYAVDQCYDAVDRIKTIAAIVIKTHVELEATKKVLEELQARSDATGAELLTARTFVNLHQATYDAIKRIVADM